MASRELVDASARPDASVAEGSASVDAAAEGSEVAETPEAEEVILQRCPDPFPHIAHDVPALGSRTGFRCTGAMTEDDFERLLAEAFGP